MRRTKILICRQIRTTVCGIAFLLVLEMLLGYSVDAQQGVELGNGWLARHDLFQMLLEEQGLSVVESMEEALVSPRRSVVILVGVNQRSSHIRWNRVLRFVQEGGALFVASDGPLDVAQLGRLQAGPVTTSDARWQYQGYSDCLQLPLTRNMRSDFSLVRTIVTNRSGSFLPYFLSGGKWESVIRLPPEAVSIPSASPYVLSLHRRHVGEGVIAVCADPSLTSNGMLWHGDNAILAIRLSQILSRGPRSFLYFQSGDKILSSFQESLESASPPDESVASGRTPRYQDVLRMANAVVQEVAESNVLNEALRQRPRYLSAWHYFIGLVCAAGITTLLAMAWLALTAAGRTAPDIRSRPGIASYQLSGSSDDFRAEAGHLAREFCFELTESQNVRDWGPLLIDSRREWWRPLESRERESLTRIIDMAQRGCHDRMDSTSFQKLGTTMENLRALRSASQATPRHGDRRPLGGDERK